MLGAARAICLCSNPPTPAADGVPLVTLLITDRFHPGVVRRRRVDIEAAREMGELPQLASPSQ